MLLALSHCEQAFTASRLDADTATSSQALIAGFQAGSNYKITNKRTGMALDVSGLSVADGAMIWEYAYDNQNNQQWQLQQAPDGNAVLISLGADNQKWYFTPVGAASVSSTSTASPTASTPTTSTPTVAKNGLHVSGNTL